MNIIHYYYYYVINMYIFEQIKFI